jgi:hypothetical protein
MGLPRKVGICDPRASDRSKPSSDDCIQFVLRDNHLHIQDATEDDQFVKLVEAFQKLNRPPASTRELVSSHPLFPRVMEEYSTLCSEIMFQGRGRASRHAGATPLHSEMMARAHNDENKQ